MLSAVLLPLTLLPLAFAKDIPVAVGDKGLVFTPDDVTADKGDTITFSYYPQNHSVAQSSFDKPCAPMGDQAAFSGFFPTTSGKARDTFTFTVDGTSPVWLYCSQGDHCQEGMVMAINAPKTGNTLPKYKDGSKAADINVSPTQVSDNKVNVGSGSAADSSSSSSASSSSTSAASSKSSATASATGSSTGSSTGSATSSAASATDTSGAGKVHAGVGIGAMGLLGMLAGGMI